MGKNVVSLDTFRRDNSIIGEHLYPSIRTRRQADFAEIEGNGTHGQASAYVSSIFSSPLYNEAGYLPNSQSLFLESRSKVGIFSIISQVLPLSDQGYEALEYVVFSTLEGERRGRTIVYCTNLFGSGQVLDSSIQRIVPEISLGRGEFGPRIKDLKSISVIESDWERSRTFNPSLDIEGKIDEYHSEVDFLINPQKYY